jgi:serine/threonine protein kinase/tetratricopeptide (TPR) repeat protein
VSGPTENQLDGPTRDAEPAVVAPSSRRSPAPSIPPPALTRGTLVGRYVIVDVLGQGGMGTVYAAYDPDLDRRIALKVLENSTGEQSNREPRFLREAQALARLSHENVVGVHDVGVFGRDVFIAMDLVPGKTLSDWLRTEHRPRREILAVFLAAGRGLAAAHAAGLIHRDFKPGNVIVGDDGRVRVLDFGLARATRNPSSEEAPPPPSGTSPSTVEQRGGRPLSLPAPDPTPPSAPGLLPSATPSPTPVPSSTTPVPPGPDEAIAPFAARREQQPPTVRVRLATPPLGTPSEPGAAFISLGSSSSSGKLLEQQITVAGSLLGTPAYMSPEQLQRQPATEKSDQFGFAVALYEALYDAHPFGRSPRGQFQHRVIRGEVDPPPEGVKVPARLRRLLLRALAPNPGDRFASMDALLAQLAYDPGKRWRRVGATVFVAALAATTGLLLLRAPMAAAEACKGAEARLAGAWDEPTRQRVHGAFARISGSLGDEAFVAVDHVLTGYGQRWTLMQTEACRATRVLGIQSASLLDLRTACLERRVSALRALSDTFAHAESPTVTTHAVEAAFALPGIEPCADVESLLAAIPPPEGQAARARVEGVRHTIDQARALLYADDADAALAVLAPLGDGATLDYAPARAELLKTLAEAESEVARAAAGAEGHFWQALAAAAEAHDDRLAAETWVDLIDYVGFKAARPDEAFALRRSADVAIARAGHLEEQDANLMHELAHIEWKRGRFVEATRFCEKALAMHQKLHGERHIAYVGDLVLLGIILTDAGDYAAAQPVHERGLAARRELLGPDHPQVADSLDNLGVVLYHEGKLAGALEYYRQALAVREKDFGPTHPDVGTSLNNVGGVFLDRGELVEAEGSFTRALRIWEEAYGKDSVELVFALDNLGDVALARKQWAVAREHCGRALALEEPTVEKDSPNLAYHLTCLGEAWLGEGKANAAREPLERALASRLAGGGDPIELARTQFALARVLGGGGESEAAMARAKDLARAARDAYAGDAEGNRLKPKHDAVVAWLHAHGG